MSKLMFMYIYIICLFGFSTFANGQNNLTTRQIEIKNIAKMVGKSICAQNMCFSRTLQAIAWQESSFGNNIIGDRGRSLGPFQIKMSTAKRVIKKLNLKEYYYLLEDKKELKMRLLLDVYFSAVIAGNYLKMNYEYAIKIDHWNPWILTVSRYNGGNFNRNYLNKITNKIKRLT